MARQAESASIAEVIVDPDISAIRRRVDALGEVSIYPDVIIAYDSIILPSEGVSSTVISSITHCSVTPFRGETHTTIDFNGITVITSGTLSFIPIFHATPFLR